MTIKTIIGDKVDISHYLEEYQYFNLYLSYIERTGYILIAETPKNTNFNILEYRENPRQLYLNYNQEKNKEFYKLIYSYLIPYKKQLKEAGRLPHEIKEDITDIITDVIDNLTYELNEVYEADNYSQIKNYKNTAIKDYLKNPISKYNSLKKNPPLTAGEAKEKKRQTDKELLTHLQNFYDCFNSVKDIQVTDSKGNIKGTLYNDNYPIDLIAETLHETQANPLFILYLAKYGGKKNYYISQAAEELQKEFNFKRYIKGDKTELYYYNKNIRQFQEIRIEALKNVIYKTYNFNLVQDDLKKIISSIAIENKLNKNLLVFDNIYYDSYKLEVFKKDENYNRGSYLTFNNIGVEQEDGTIKLLKYNQDLYLTDIFKVKELPEELKKLPINSYKERYGMTLTELVLRMVTIPKNNPADLTFYRDFLERLGSSITGKNQYKSIGFYYGSGNDGKSTLNLFYNLIFNRLNYAVTISSFEDDFNLINFSNRLVCNMDEVTANSFNNSKDIIKRVTSPATKTEARQMYTDNTIVLNSYPNFNIYSNVMVNLDIKEDLALFNRIDYLVLPNKFIDKSEINKYNNAYPLLIGLEELLRKDYEGLSWLITAAILTYKDMKEEGRQYTLKQTSDETINIFLDEDDLTKFLNIYVEYDDSLNRSQYISNDEIASSFLKYMELLNKPVKEQGLKQKIGMKINKLFDLKEEDKYKKNDRLATYSLRLKSFEDLEKERTTIYEINEDVTDQELTALNYSADYMVIYEEIQKGVNTTIKELDNKYKNKNNLDIVRALKSLNLITETSNLKLDDF